MVKGKAPIQGETERRERKRWSAREVNWRGWSERERECRERDRGWVGVVAGYNNEHWGEE